MIFKISKPSETEPRKTDFRFTFNMLNVNRKSYAA